jgi:bifunctional non-homologous end joining protein LigD
VAALLKKAPKSAIPTGITPMLATLVEKPFDDADWVFEVKWDGYRALAFITKKSVEIVSRNNKPFNEKFYPIHKALKGLGINAVVDGEILVLTEKGVSHFGQLQNWRSEADGELVFYVFDLLWYEGKNLMNFTLRERQAILKEVLPVTDTSIRLSNVFDTGGIEFFDAAAKLGLEGIIAKKASSLYTPGLRTKEWLKIKANQRQEVVVAGYTKNEDSAKSFSSLLLGVYENKKLQYVGKVGTGFSAADQKKMLAQFKPYITDKSPFETIPDVNKPSRFQHKPPKATATWLKPVLVCEVEFTEVTSDGVFRHPSFQGMRIDKKASDVVREKAIATTEAVADEKPVAASGKKILQPSKGKERKTLLNPTDETQVRKINGHELKFTNLSKVYWPDDNVTKRDMFNYYYQVADYILPYLKDRPMSLNRFPGGINSNSFYQKDIKGKAPAWITKTFPYTTSDGESKEYLVGADEAVLLWMASLGCIEMNPWFSRVQSPDNPDYCVIDLDPDKNTFDQVIEAALETKKVLDTLDVPCYCKTSGSTGMHIYIPLGAKYSYDQSQMFANLVVSIVHHHLPDFTSLERLIAKRKGKMYLDFLQNRPGATIAGPYSLRPKKGATVSMPLHWSEVKPGLTMKDFTIFNAVDRLKVEGDLFKGVLGKGIDLEKTIKKAQRLV